MLRVSMPLMVLGCSASGATRAMQARAERLVADGKLSDATILYDSVLSIDQHNAVALEKVGLLEYELGQLSRAYSRLLAAERLAPRSAQVRLGLGGIALIRGKRDEARQEAATVLQAEPKNADALLLFGASAVDPADVDDAIQRLENATFDPARLAYGRLVLVSLYQQKRDSSSAARAIRDIGGRDTSWLVRATTSRLSRSAGRATAIVPPGSAADLRRSVDLYLLMNRRDWAVESLRELVSASPSDVPALRQLSELSVADGNLADATKYLDSLLRRDSTDADARVLRITIQAASGNTRDALDESKAVLTAFPWLTPARFALAHVLAQLDSVSRGETELRTVVREAPNYPAAVHELAGFYLRRGDAAGAADILNKLVAVDPNSVSTYALLGWAYRANGEPKRASAAFREISKVSPKSAQGPYWIGIGLAAEGRYDDAKAQFEEALRRSPGDADALAQLAQISFSQRRPGEALERVKKQLDIVSDRWQLWNVLGLASEQAHEDDKARDAYLTAMRLDPRVIEPRSHLASLDLRVGRPEEAVTTLRGILNLDPTNLPALMLLGGELDRQGAVAGAREAYERILQLYPRRADAANNLAVLLSRTGKDDARAIQLAELALSIDPKNPHVADTLGWLLCRGASIDSAGGAKPYLRAAGLLAFSASQLPENPAIQFHLGVARQKSGDVQGAREAFTRALQSTASFPERKDAERALAGLK